MSTYWTGHWRIDWIPVVLCLRLIERYMQCLLRTWYRYYLLLLRFNGKYTICDYGCAKATVVWDESSSNDKLKKSIRYVINNKYCVLYCVLSARLWIDIWIHHGTSCLKLAHVQLAFNCDEWLFQEVQGRVSQKLLFIIVAVVSLSAIFSMYYSMHYVCGKYITIINALFKTPYWCSYKNEYVHVCRHPRFKARLPVADELGCPLFVQASNLDWLHHPHWCTQHLHTALQYNTVVVTLI